METNILTPKELFQKDIRYTIPAFQRRYVWTKEKQWEPLWDDVRNTADTYLEELDKASDGRHSASQARIVAERATNRHFLGAVVVQQVSTATRDVERREVIDGQQRLTTLQLLLDAVQFVCEERGMKHAARRLSKLVTNDLDLVGDDDHALKLWPTTNDRAAFKHAMDNGLATDEYEDSQIVKAHEYFQLQARHWLGVNDEAASNRTEALEIAVTGMLRLVVIDLDPLDDPYVIFETLNARGTPLLESDLVKNYVMSKVGKANSNQVWGNLDLKWWRKDVRQGRLIRPRIDALLDYWLEMRTVNDVSIGQVFKVFRSVVDEAGGDVSTVMAVVCDDLTNYRCFETNPQQPAERVFRYRADIMQMGAFTPALLKILSSPDRARSCALQALESFMVRRMVCRGTTKDYNRLSLDLVRELTKHSMEHAGRIVVDFLRSQEADSRQWPTDGDVDHALRTLPLYRLLTRGRLRMVLEGIEEYYRAASHAEQTEVPKRLTIEHILPRSWEANWPLPDSEDDEEVRENRQRMLHTIGNLTLVTQRLNSVQSNAPWEHKRKTLGEHSILRLNHNLLTEYRDAAWDERSIEARSGQLAGLIAKVWPGRNSDSWDRAE